MWISGHLARRNIARLVVPFEEDQFAKNSYLPKITLDSIKIHPSRKWQRLRGDGPREAANSQGKVALL